MSQRTCATCQVAIDGSPKRLFCSDRCRVRKARGYQPPLARSCAACGADFTPIREWRADQPARFCSLTCISWARKNPDGRQRVRATDCVECGEQFTASNIRQTICSQRCRQHRVNSMRRVYLLGLPSEVFATRDIFIRDDWTCYLCGNPVHKRRAVSGEYDPLLASLDHLIPVSAPGCPGHLRWNVATAHIRCNIQKQDAASKEAIALSIRLRFLYESGAIAA